MTNQFCCEYLKRAILDQNVPIVYVPKFREFGLKILDGGSSFLHLHFCPWSGTKLPGSLRDKWFETLESLGIDPTSDLVPPEFLDDRWYTGNSSHVK